MRGLEGLRTLVTGGAQGIGRAVAERLVDEGAALGVIDLVEPADLQGAKFVLSADVTSPVDVDARFSEAAGLLGGIDALVLAAGVHHAGPTHEMAVEDFDRVMAVSVRGTFLCLRAALPAMMAARAGRIVTFGSTAALVGAPGLAAYAAAKGGVLQLTRSVAAEYGEYGITSNCICPGATNTPLLRRLQAERSDPGEFERRQPLGRFAEPEEVAGAVAFMLSDDAAFMNGAALAYDGGFTAI